MDKITLTATTRFGLEGIVKNELSILGYKKLSVSDGKIDIEATFDDVPRLNLWLRCAERIFLKFGEFQVSSFDELFENTKALPWEHVIPQNGKFAVVGTSVKSKLQSVRSCQSIIKKAVVDRLKDKYDTESLPEAGPEYTIHFALVKDTVTLAIDTSGTGLHKRGYRKVGGEAPLKETLAAGLVLLSSWGKGKKYELLVDPMCGSGTIPIEAAMIARNIAPGLKRGFAAEKWPVIKDSAWKEARLHAYDVINFEQIQQISGYDIDGTSIQTCKTNAAIAGVENNILFEQKDIKDLWIDRQFGTVITNPPYGKRMSEMRDLNELYRTINSIFKKKDGWSIFILTADSMFPKYFKRSRPDRVRKLYNGTIKVNYYQYLALKKPPAEK